MQLISIPDAFCNDGSNAGVYRHLSSNNNPQRIVMHLQGGGFCYSLESCTDRWRSTPQLMSLVKASQTIALPTTGILAQPESDVYFFPYCSSDSFSGNATQTATPWRFEGAKIFRNAVERGVVRLNRVAVDGVLFSGSSAGAEGLYPHADWLAAYISALPRPQLVHVLVDSGFFLQWPPFHQGDCSQLGACTEFGAMQRGVPLWNAVVDQSCDAHFSAPSQRWRCMLGAYVVSFITAPLFLFQFRFDSAQLGHDGIYHLPRTAQELAYASVAAQNLTTQVESLHNIRGFFLPSCFFHTIIRNPGWKQVLIDGVDVWTAFRKGVQLSDKCNVPNCNPTCENL